MEKKIDIKYELFILALSILSIVNLVLGIIFHDPDLTNVIYAIDMVLSMVFLGDFLKRLFSAESKVQYFFKQLGWLDLLSSLPFPRLKVVRLVRIVRAIRLMRKYNLKQMIDKFANDQAGSAMYAVSVLVILMIEFGSIAILAAEKTSAEANILTANDALWWSLVTISTVGYGDHYPVTGIGRTIAIVVIVIGVGLFGIVTGFLANRFLKDEGGGEGGDNTNQNKEQIKAQILLLEKISKDIKELKKMQDK